MLAKCICGHTPQIYCTRFFAEYNKNLVHEQLKNAIKVLQLLRFYY